MFNITKCFKVKFVVTKIAKKLNPYKPLCQTYTKETCTVHSFEIQQGKIAFQQRGLGGSDTFLI